jgi:CSLREA domain-containing protein
MKRTFPFTAAILMIMMSAAVAFGAVFTVTKSTDTAGVCDSDCSLREAVAAAVASPETDDVIVSAKKGRFVMQVANSGLGGNDLNFTSN